MLKDTAARDFSPATTTLTTAYASGWASEPIPCGHADYLSLRFSLDQGDATSVQLELDASDDGSDWHIAIKDDGSNEALSRTVTPSTDEKFSRIVDVRDAQYLRVRAKKTGGVGTVTLTLAVAASQER